MPTDAAALMMPLFMPAGYATPLLLYAAAIRHERAAAICRY